MFPDLSWRRRLAVLCSLAAASIIMALLPDGASPAGAASSHTSTHLYRSIRLATETDAALPLQGGDPFSAGAPRILCPEGRRRVFVSGHYWCQPRPGPEPSVVVVAHPRAAAAPSPARPAVTSDPQAYALSIIGSAQFSCLLPLWNRESGWDLYATNPNSGAYGIPQALPGSKMASAGPDWRTDALTQVKWGLGYIASTYGSACAAWAHEQSTGWY